MLADFVSLSIENGLEPEHCQREALGFAKTLRPEPWSGHERVLAKLMEAAG
jgi:hypothetical protein